MLLIYSQEKVICDITLYIISACLLKRLVSSLLTSTHTNTNSNEDQGYYR